MTNRLLIGVAWIIASAMVFGACSTAPETRPGQADSTVTAPSATSAASLPAINFDDFVTSMCLAFDSMFEAIGNPDTASGSALSKKLDEAVQTKDGAAADRLAAPMTRALEDGRRQAAVAAGYPSGAPMAIQLDRVLAAFVVMVAAKRSIANGVSGAPDPQTAFERAGGLDAWRAMFEVVRAIDRPAGAPVRQCPTVPVSL